jgi:predicted acylesterase/phospholipase RssA
MENSRPLRLRSYTVSSEESVRCTIVDAARATSAAPPFFDPIELKGVGVTLRDGAFRANNPIQELISEVESQFSVWQLSCVVSIGTGVQADETFGRSLTSIAKMCSKIATDTEEVHRQFKERECKPGGRFRDKYFRFNVSQGLQGIGLEEWKEMDSMWSKTYTYMRDIREELDDCMSSLREAVYEGPRYVNFYVTS